MYASRYKDVKESESTGPHFCLSSRFALAIACFFGAANVYAQRVNFSVGLVCMLNHTHLASQGQKLSGNVSRLDIPSLPAKPECQSAWSAKGSSSKEDGSFQWSKKEQGLLLGAFFWGYLVTQLPGGLLAQKIGGKRVWLWTMAVGGVATLLVPVAAQVHVALLIALRVLIGLCEGVTFPSAHTIWSHWAPPLERSLLTGFSYAGAQIGNVITFPFSGFLCGAVGWESIFYVFGGLGLLWCVVWFFVATDSPVDNKRMDEAERNYILNSLQGQMDHSANKKTLKVPWRAILTSMPVWAIFVANACANFGVYLILTSLPTFLKEALGFDIKSNGLFSAIPYIAYWLCINIAGYSSDNIRKHKWLSTTNVRKLYMVLSLGAQGGFFIATGYCECGEEMLAVAYLTLAQGLSGLQYGGWVVNHVDIAPRFAGTLLGCSNTLGTIPGIVAPFLAAQMTAGVPSFTPTQQHPISFKGRVWMWLRERGKNGEWSLLSGPASSFSAPSFTRSLALVSNFPTISSY